jgi:hypothetical protein
MYTNSLGNDEMKSITFFCCKRSILRVIRIISIAADAWRAKDENDITTSPNLSHDE